MSSALFLFLVLDKNYVNVGGQLNSKGISQLMDAELFPAQTETQSVFYDRQITTHRFFVASFCET